MELTTVQLLIIGAIATVLAQGLKLLAAKVKGQVLSKQTVSLVAFVVSVILAVGFMWPQLQPLLVAGEPIAVMNAVVSGAAAVAGAAGLIYNLLAEKLFEKLAFTQARLAGGG